MKERITTKRIEVNSDLKNMIGRVLNSNLFSTFRGKLLYIQNEKCYFEILENEKYPKYNQCAGQIDYLPERLVITSIFEEDEEF
jgi:hypothetical protein